MTVLATGLSGHRRLRYGPVRNRLLEVHVSPLVARVMAPRHVRLQPVPAAAYDLDVRAYLPTKLRALAAHRSQLASTGKVPRNNALLLRVPQRALAPAMGHERYADPAGSAAGGARGSSLAHDLFAGLEPR